MNAGWFFYKIITYSIKNSNLLSYFIDTCNATEKVCPDIVGAEVSLAEYVVYLIFINILLINILIAIFKYYIIRFMLVS